MKDHKAFPWRMIEWRSRSMPPGEGEGVTQSVTDEVL